MRKRFGHLYIIPKTDDSAFFSDFCEGMIFYIRRILFSRWQKGFK